MDSTLLSQFQASMHKLGPWEHAPKLAVAVSGGADSMALALLAHAWAKSCGGDVTALTVDHALRPDSAREAAQVGEWLLPRGIAHHILRWDGPKPTANLQAHAREARYDLLTCWCREHGAAHLLLGHHQDDQAETFLLRLARGSGVDGLAGMAAIRELSGVRLLRPLLTFPKSALIEFLRVNGQEWIDDPSNLSPKHARNRMRHGRALLEAEGLTTARLAATAAAMARARAALEEITAQLLAQCTEIHPEGYAYLQPEPLLHAPEEIGLRALAALLGGIGGADYRPRLAKLERLYANLSEPVTLGGCRFTPSARRSRQGQLLITREWTPIPSASAVFPCLWDGRFELSVDASLTFDHHFSLRPLGAKGWHQAKEAMPSLTRLSIPKTALYALPSLWRLETLLSAPHIDYHDASVPPLTARFRPSGLLGARLFIP